MVPDVPPTLLASILEHTQTSSELHTWRFLLFLTAFHMAIYRRCWMLCLEGLGLCLKQGLLDIIWAAGMGFGGSFFWQPGRTHCLICVGSAVATSRCPSGSSLGRHSVARPWSRSAANSPPIIPPGSSACCMAVPVCYVGMTQRITTTRDHSPLLIQH